MKKRLFVCAVAAIVAAVGLLAGCGADEEERKEVKERELRNLPANVAYQVETLPHTVNYTDSEGREIAIYGQIVRPKAAGKFPAIILSHGYNNHYSGFTAECNRFAARGYVCYAFDFCGAQADGMSTGRSKEEYTPFTMKEDLLAVIGDMKTLDKTDETQIFLFGGSQGGFVTAITAADDAVKNEISAVGMYFPAFNIPHDWQEKYPDESKIPAEGTAIEFWGYYVNASFVRSVYSYDPFAAIPAYPGDVCIVWGDADPIVLREYITRAVEAYGEDRAQLTVLPGAEHGFGGADLNKAIETVLAFFEAHTYI